MSTSASGSSSTGGVVTECDTDSDCAAVPKHLCVHPDHLCGNGVKGQCVFCVCGGEGCSNSFLKFCGCAGAITKPKSGCDNFDYSKDAATCNAGTFACGAKQCKRYAEYCVPGGPNAGCFPAPSGCDYGIASCYCLTHNLPGSQCADDGNGGVTPQCGAAGDACSAQAPCCAGSDCRKGICVACGGQGADCSVSGEDGCCTDSFSCRATATAGVSTCTICVGDGGTPTPYNGVTPPCCCATPLDPFLNQCHALPNGPGAACNRDCLCASGDCDATGHCK